jgi:signal transduction histidine kinase
MPFAQRDGADSRAGASEDGSAARAEHALREAVRVVAGRVADELGNPVAALSSRLELMLAEADDRAEDTGLLEDLRALERSARRLIRLVEALRCYSGGGVAGPRPVGLNEIVSRALATTGVSPASLVLDPSDPPILATPASLERFLTRFLADACHPASADVRVETRPADGEPYQVALAVSGGQVVPGLDDYGRHVLAEHAGELDVRLIEGHPSLTLTFPRLTLRLPPVPTGGPGRDGELD